MSVSVRGKDERVRWAQAGSGAGDWLNSGADVKRLLCARLPPLLTMDGAAYTVDGTTEHFCLLPGYETLVRSVRFAKS